MQLEDDDPDTTTDLPRRIVGWYSLGALPGGLGATAGNFLVFYYNQVLGIPAATVGFALLLAAVFDAVSDPIAGAISDRTASRFGRRHPYMLATSLPIALAFYCIWVPPAGLSQPETMAWLVGWLLFQRLAGTFYAVPYLALGAEMSSDYQERTFITTMRAYVSNVGRSTSGALLLLVFLRATPEFPNGQMNPSGYLHFALLFSIVTAIALVLSAWNTRSIIPRLAAPTHESSWSEAMAAPLRDIRDALRLRAFRMLTFGALLKSIAWGVSDAIGLYMATFFWGISTDLLFFWGVGMFSGMFIGFGFWRRMGVRLDKKTMYLVGTAGYVIFFTIPYLLKVVDFWPARESALYLPLYILTTGFLAHFFSAAPAILTGSMLGDITDLDEVEHGRRREGVIFGAENLGAKAFSGLGPVVAGFVVDFAGIEPNMDPASVSEQAVTTLGLTLGGIMCVLISIAFILMTRYDLTRERHSEILETLSERRRSS